jgi:hypothetical protein
VSKDTKKKGTIGLDELGVYCDNCFTQGTFDYKVNAKISISGGKISFGEVVTKGNVVAQVHFKISGQSETCCVRVFLGI